MTKTYNIPHETAVDQVRLLAQEHVLTAAVFEDEEIELFLALEGDDVLLGAAQTLETLAANQTLVLKKIQLLELSTDGPALASSLLAIAARYRERANSMAAEAGFDIAEPIYTHWQYRDLVKRHHGIPPW